MADVMRDRDPRVTRAVHPGTANEMDVEEFLRRVLSAENLPMASAQPAVNPGQPMTPATPETRSNPWAGPVGRKPRSITPRGV